MQRRQARKVFAENLRNALAKAGMSQSDLARRARVSRDSISTYTNERSLPSPAALVKLARVLKVDTEALLPVKLRADRGNWMQITTTGNRTLFEARVELPISVVEQVAALLQPYVGA